MSGALAQPDRVNGDPVSGHGLTVRQRQAVELLRDHGISYVSDPNRYGVVTSGGTHLSSGQPWINWRTAYALQRRGLARVQGYEEECEVILVG